ncbi:unnamed protein product [Musa acuminata subsp. malaccensis]|uniref:(wild Malaysian banana) hypothetical protein n=1 Tax=Musa acuminata subsp. malaccensis TaxID=214687 RepID=A0A804JQS3_MUSAM|nr:unnamed protein product [Musa acuminata subsp. malaccensis]
MTSGPSISSAFPQIWAPPVSEIPDDEERRGGPWAAPKVRASTPPAPASVGASRGSDINPPGRARCCSPSPSGSWSASAAFSFLLAIFDRTWVSWDPNRSQLIAEWSTGEINIAYNRGSFIRSMKSYLLTSQVSAYGWNCSICYTRYYHEG